MTDDYEASRVECAPKTEVSTPHLGHDSFDPSHKGSTGNRGLRGAEGIKKVLPSWDPSWRTYEVRIRAGIPTYIDVN